jgi:hypothetical protein
MGRKLLVALILFICASSVFAQKKATIFGDTWTGEVVAANETTREITLRYTGKGETETFTGILEEGDKVKRNDGSLQALKVSEIVPGTRIRVFYKTKQQDVGGVKTKVRSIYRVNFLGRDEYTRLRESLNLEPTAPVSLAESETFPAATPLKVYLATELPHIKDRFVVWLRKWNKEKAAKYGPLELVPELAQSDVALVAYRGSEHVIQQLPMEFYDRAGNPHKGMSSHATAYIVVRGDAGLKVLWSRDLIVTSLEKVEISDPLFEKEIEKRMKARTPKK